MTSPIAQKLLNLISTHQFKQFNLACSKITSIDHPSTLEAIIQGYRWQGKLGPIEKLVKRHGTDYSQYHQTLVQYKDPVVVNSILSKGSLLLQRYNAINRDYRNIFDSRLKKQYADFDCNLQALMSEIGRNDSVWVYIRAINIANRQKKFEFIPALLNKYIQFHSLYRLTIDTVPLRLLLAIKRLRDPRLNRVFEIANDCFNARHVSIKVSKAPSYKARSILNSGCILGVNELKLLREICICDQEATREIEKRAKDLNISLDA